MHLELVELLIVGAAVFIGAVVQGTVGFGAVIAAFPVIVIVEPMLLPQAAILSTLPLAVIVYLRHRSNVNMREVAQLGVSRVPGIVVGTYVVKVLSSTTLALMGAGLVLLVVLVTAAIPPVPRNAATIGAAGFASGLLGTAVAIGGPPIGLLYQHESGPEIRGTVGAVSIIGISTTILGLWIGGEMSATDVRTGLAMMPFGLAGVVAARYAEPWADQRIRRIVQILSIVGAALAIVRLLL